ncbi:MAG: hypothetical protein ACI90V_001773 [Bacillariaceae sp.]
MTITALFFTHKFRSRDWMILLVIRINHDAINSNFQSHKF